MPILSHGIRIVRARLADLFGWISVDRRLSKAELTAAGKAAASLARSEVSSVDVLAAIGPPSIIAGSDVHIYAGPQCAIGWLFLDYDFEPPSPGHYARAGAPPTSWCLRAIRMPSNHWYSQRFRYTPRGRRSLRRN
jgi:hypothetical protein